MMLTLTKTKPANSDRLPVQHDPLPAIVPLSGFSCGDGTGKRTAWSGVLRLRKKGNGFRR